MEFQQCVNSCVTCSIDNIPQFLQISIIELIFFRLKAGPHNSKSDGIEAVLPKFLHILFGKGHMLIIGISFGEVRRDFDGNVHSVEKDLSVLVIEDMAVLDSETEDKTEGNTKEKKCFPGRNEISDHGMLIKYFIMAKIKKPRISTHKNFHILF